MFTSLLLSSFHGQVLDATVVEDQPAVVRVSVVDLSASAVPDWFADPGFFIGRSLTPISFVVE